MSPCARDQVGKASRTANQVPCDQHAHQTALRVVQVIPVAHPALRLSTDFAILSLLVTRWSKVLAEVVDEVLGDEGRFGDHEGLGLAGGLDADDG